MPVRVLVVGPRQIVRAALVALLRDQPQIRPVGDADGPLNRTQPECDLALWDVGSLEPQATPVRCLVMLSDPRRAPAWLRAGATGCVLDTASVEELLSGIRQVSRGETFVSPIIMQEVIAAAPPLTQNHEQLESLTGREQEVLQLLAQGLSNKDIAQRLYVSVRTVEGHLANAYGKLNLRSRTEAALWVIQH